MSQHTALAGAQLRAAKPAFTPAGTVRNLSSRFGRRLLGLLAALALGGAAQAQSSTNYTFSTNTTGSLAADKNGNTIDVSGITASITSSADQTVFAATNIGFDFYLMGNRYSQFSFSANGLISLGSTSVSGSIYSVSGGSTTTPKLSAFGSDLGTGTSGSIKYQVVGTAPNRCLVIQFSNMTLLWTSSYTNDGTYQARLYEDGTIEYVYGAMSITSTASAGSTAVGIGWSVSSSSGQYASVTSSTNANSTSAFNTNSYSAGAITNLNSASNGSRRTYRWTPAAVAAPTSLTFGGGSSSLTLNWTASSPITNVLKYDIYSSTDNVTYNFLSSVAVGTNTYTATGLSSSTTYYFKVYAQSEGALSTALSGSSTTNAPGTVTANAVSGNWSSGSSWAGGAVPGSLDDVVIPNGATITIDASAGNPTVKSLTIGGGSTGNLIYNATAAQTLTVTNDVTINAGASFKSAASGSITSHALSIGGSLTNNGTIDFSTSTNTAAAIITFTGSAAATWTNSGTSSTNLRATSSVILNKGTSIASTLTFSPGGTFTVQAANTAGFLSITNGQFILGGTGAFSNPVFSSNSYTIPSTGGVWLDNPNATIVALGGTQTLSGQLKISQGIFNVGTGTGNSITSSGTATYIMDGGTLSIASRFNITTGTFNMSAGTINLNTSANTSTSIGSMNFTGSTFTMSGGTINLVQASTAATPYDWNVVPTTTSITGGTLNIGTAATATNFLFRLLGSVPAVVTNNTTNAKNISLSAATTAYGDVTISSGTTLTLNAFTLTLRSALLTNNGTINGTAVSSRLSFAGTSAQTFAGAGTVTSALDGMSVSNSAGLNLTHTNQIVTLRVNLFQGAVTGAGKLTIGSGGTSASTIQVGNATATTNIGGSLDAAPTFNIGSGGFSLLYLSEGAARTTGFEVPTSRTVTTMTVSNSNGVTVSGGNISVGTLNLGTNLTTSSSNMVIVTGTTPASIVRTFSSAGGSGSGTTITVTSTTNLQLGMTVAVTGGTGAFAANTTVTSIPTSTTFVVSAAPTTTLSGATVTATGGYVNGPLALTLPASLASGSTYIFPIGKSSYVPVDLVNPTTGAGGTVVISAEAFDGSSGGSATNFLSDISSTRYWNLSLVSGGSNFTAGTLRLNDTRGSFDAIGRSTTQNGAYDLLGANGTTLTTTSITSSAGALTSANLAAYYLMATKASPSLSNLAITPSGNQCTNVARTVTVTVTPAAGAITGVVLNYTVNGAGSTNVSMTNTGGNTWSGVIPTVTPSTATVAWSVTATDVNNLTKSQSGTSYSDEPLSGFAGTITGTTPICQNTATNLTAIVAKSATVQLGTGSTSSSTTSNLGVPYPTYYGNGRQQYLVLASELQTLGLTAGNITSLAFDVVTPGTTNNLNGYTIKIGTTSATSITTFQSPTFTTVFGPSNFTPVTGVNTHNFSTPFVWDGTSNIIVDICFSNGNTGTAAKQNVVKQTSTAFASTVGYQLDGTTSTACTATTVSVSGSIRPNMVFGGQVGTGGLTYSWSDGTNNVGSGSPLAVSPQATTTYTFTATDANGCSVTSAPKTITVIPAPTAPTATNSTQCGQGAPGASVASTSGAGSPVFRWYAAQTGGSALQNSTSTTYTTSINATTTFWVAEYNGTTGCESVRTQVTATVTSADPVSASANGPVCLGNTVTLTATQTGSANTYVYTWTASPAAGSGIPVSTSGASANVVPTAMGTYTYTVVANDATLSCTTSSTVNVTVNGNPSITSVTASPTSVCPGGNIALTATNTVSGTATIGSAGTTTSTSGISPFSQGWETSHSQYLIKASDLQAAGLSAGNLTSVAFNVSTASSTLTFAGYTMKIAHTSATALSGLLSPTFTTVYGPSTYPAVTTTGLKTLTFATPFNWDGSSNLLVDVCFSNDPNSNITDNYSSTSTVRATAKSYTASYGYYQDNGNICGTTGSSTSNSVNLPDMTFGGQVAGPAVNWTWTPGNLSGASVTAVAPNTPGIVTYTAKATFAATGCFTTSSVNVNVGGTLTVAANAASSAICVGGSTTLTATPSGGGAPYTYSWSDGTTTVGSSASISVSPAQSTTYTVTVTDFCGTMATQNVSVTVNALPTVSIAPGIATTVCAASQTLTSTTNAATPAYQWLLAASNISGANAASYSAAATGNYSLKVTDGVTGCQNTSAATTLTFQLFPSATVVTPASAESLCLGNAQTLTASATVPTIILNENFNSGATGWTTSNASTVNTVNWYLQTAPYTDAAGSATFQNFSVDGSTFAYSNSDVGGSGSTTDTKLVSPAFSTVNYTSASLTFQHVFRSYVDDVTVAVQYSTNGTTWTNLKSYSSSQGTTTNNGQVAANETIALPAGALNQASLRIRFNYVSAWGYYWIVDNVKVTGAASIQYAWASTAGSGLTAGQQAASASNNSISVTPTAAGSYTYNVTASISGSSCTSSNSVSLTVVTPSVAPSGLNASVSGTVCAGTNVILTQTGGSLGQGAYWQWYKDAAYTQTVGGQLASANAQITVSPSATTSYYLRAEGGTAPCAAIVAAASPVTITVYTASVAGTLSSSQSICSGSTPASVALAGSNGSIQWQSATDAAFTQNVVNYGTSAATLTGTDIGALTQSTYIRAVVTNGTGCASATSNTVLITVNSYPVVYSVQGSATYCDGIGSIVSLSGSEPGTNYQLLKNGSNQGSPVAGTGSAISFGVRTAGTYTVVASNAAGCSVSMSGSAVINAVGPFFAQISAQNSILCSAGNFTTIYISNGPVNGNVTVTVNGGNAQTYTLDGNGSYSFQTAVLNANATYTITAVGNGSCATPSSISTTVYVGALVADALPGQSVCPGSTVGPITFQGNFPAGTTYSWTSTNPAIGLAQASGSGTALPSFTATNGGSSIIYSDIAVTPNLDIEGCEVRGMVFRISVKPTPTINATGNQVLCAGAATTAVNFSGNMLGATYIWTNSNPAIGMVAQGAGTIPSFTATNNTNQSSISGTFTVTPNFNGCAGTPSTFTITVNKASAVINYPNSPYCPVGPATPQITGTRGGVFSAAAGVVFYSTTTGEINLGASQPGVYTITYTVTGTAGGCGGSSTTSITILPRATVNTIGNQALCANTMTNMVQPTGTATSFSWVNLNPTVGLPASGTGAIPAFTALNNSPNVVTAQINVTPMGDGANTCNGNPVAYRYTIYPRPTVTPVNSGNPYIYCRNTLSTPVTFTSATPNTTYGWTNNNTTVGLASRGTGNIASFLAANPLVASANIATVTVTPTANKCAGTPYQFVIEVDDCITQSGNSGGDGNTARMAAQVVVGPNPTTNRVTIYYKGTDAGPFTVQLITQYGQAISKPVTFTGNSYTLDLTGMTPGAYVLQLVNTRTKATVQKQVIKL